MKTTDYQHAKDYLKAIASNCRIMHKNDNPLWRMILNDELDSVIKSGNFSDYQKKCLANYVCKLHPKN